jgi:hypothetical protein
MAALDRQDHGVNSVSYPSGALAYHDPSSFTPRDLRRLLDRRRFLCLPLADDDLGQQCREQLAQVLAPGRFSDRFLDLVPLK